MKRVVSTISSVLLLLFCLGCSLEKKDDTSLNTRFNLTVIDSALAFKSCHLYSLHPFVKIDAVDFKNGQAQFTDTIQFPKRFYILPQPSVDGILLILEPDHLILKLNSNDIANSAVLNSPINDELKAYQKMSEKISSKIELLFPDIQRARLNNDGVTLDKLFEELKVIELENIEYSLNYAKLNPDSFVSAMILNDLLQGEGADSSRIKSYFLHLNKEVQKSSDGQLIKAQLSL